MFSITLHKKDLTILESLQAYFGGIGKIYPQGKTGVQFQVFSLQELTNIIITFFNKYRLITQKQADFELFKMAFEIINRKEHLSIEGLRKIVAIKSSINWGLPQELRKQFPDIIITTRPLIEVPQILDSHWVAGFVAGEACFMIKLKPAQTKLGEAAHLEFQISQSLRDEQLMINFISYFKAGKCHNNGKAIDFRVAKFSDIIEKIIPFFDKYPVIGTKYQDYIDFKLVSELMKNKAHLTREGLDKIRLIKSGANKGRKLI